MDDVTEHNMWQAGQLLSKEPLRNPIVISSVSENHNRTFLKPLSKA